MTSPSAKISLLVFTPVASLLLAGAAWAQATSGQGDNVDRSVGQNLGSEREGEYRRQQADRLLKESLMTSFDTSNYKIPKLEMKALRDLDKAIQHPAADRAKALLPKTETAVTSPDGKFVLGALKIRLGAKLNDVAMQSAGTDMVIDSGIAAPAALTSLYRNQATFALNANDLVKAEKAYSRIAQTDPNDGEALVSLAQIKSDLGKHAEAVALFDKAIALKSTANQPVPEIWTKAAAYNGRIVEKTAAN